MRSEKQYLLDEIKEQLDVYKNFFVFRYLGLTANEANEMRCAIADTGGNMEMVSKRLFLKAASENGMTVEKKQLAGHIGIVLAGKDPIETTKVFYNWLKEKEEKFEVLLGRIEEKNYDASQIETLSKLPGKKAMYAQFLATLEAPLIQTVGVMQTLLTSVPHCLENRSGKL